MYGERTSLAKLAKLASVLQVRDSHGERNQRDREPSAPKRQSYPRQYWTDERSLNLSLEFQTKALMTMQIKKTCIVATVLI
jgi:hypothetical protein